jgi:hypothetical protein
VRPGPHPDIPTTRIGNTRLTGLAIAGVVALASIGLVLWFALVSRPRHTPAARLAAEAAPVDAPDIRALSLADSPGQAQLTRSGRTIVQWSDKADPTRKAGELEYDVLQPLESKRYLMERPRARIYLRDGRTVTVESARARVYWPTMQNTRPESASLEGDAVIRLYERGVDPATGTPMLTTTSPTLSFDGTLGELSTADRLTLTSPNVEYTGVGMRLVYNEARERLELLRVETGHELTIREMQAAPRARPAGAVAANTAPTASDASIPGSSPRTAPTPTLTLYNALLLGDVRMDWGNRHMTGDRLYLWTRLVDNRLRPGALGRPVSGPVQARPVTASPDAATPPPIPSASGHAPAKGETEPLRLTWTGPLEVTPLEHWPEELADNDIAARLTAEAGKDDQARVRFWEEGGHEGWADGVEYLATTRDLRAWGGPLTLVTRDGQQLRAPRITLNLATGVGHVRGGGLIRGGIVRADDRDEDKIGQVEWSEQADFLFDVSESGDPAGQLRDAAFLGDVRLREDARPDAPGFWLDAPVVRARFAPVSTDAPALIRRLVVTDGMRAGDGRGAELAAQEADLAFTPGPDGLSVVPTLASARGSVRATREGSTVTADALDARLHQVEGTTRVERVLASGNVRFERDDGTTAIADHLAAGIPLQIVELTGSPAMVEQGGGRLESAFIRLDGLQRRAETPGPGRFTQEPVEGGPAGRVVATWDGSMWFDDVAGTLECVGGTRVESRPDPWSLDTAIAQSVRASFTPALPVEPGEPRPPRRLLHLRLEAATGERAGVESRRLDPARPDSPTLERMVYLESQVLDLDADAGVFTAPGPGRLLASDRRPAPAAPLSPAPSLGRGDTLIDWEGSLRYERATGLATLDRSVRLTHSPMSGDLLNLECDTLTAMFAPPPEGETSPLDPLAAGGELRRVLAVGAAWLRAGTRELTGSTIDYDASTGVARALAGPGSTVVFLDPASAAPIRAPAMIWNTRTGRIEVVRPETIVITR